MGKFLPRKSFLARLVTIVWFFQIMNFKLLFKWANFCPRKSFLVRLATAKYFLFQTPPQCWQRDKKRANRRKVCDVGNVERQKFCHILTAAHHVSLSHFPLIVVGSLVTTWAKRQHQLLCLLAPIHLVGDGSFFCKCELQTSHNHYIIWLTKWPDPCTTCFFGQILK